MESFIYRTPSGINSEHLCSGACKKENPPSVFSHIWKDEKESKEEVVEHESKVAEPKANYAKLLKEPTGVLLKPFPTGMKHNCVQLPCGYPVYGCTCDSEDKRVDLSYIRKDSFTRHSIRVPIWKNRKNSYNPKHIRKSTINPEIFLYGEHTTLCRWKAGKTIEEVDEEIETFERKKAKEAEEAEEAEMVEVVKIPSVTASKLNLEVIDCAEEKSKFLPSQKRRKTKKSSTHFKRPKRGKNRKEKTHFSRSLRWQETDEEAMYCTSYKCEMYFDYDEYWCPFHGDYHCPYVYDYDDDSGYYYESDFEDYGLQRDYYYDNGVRVYFWDDYRLPRDYWNDSD